METSANLHFAYANALKVIANGFLTKKQFTLK